MAFRETRADSIAALYRPFDVSAMQTLRDDEERRTGGWRSPFPSPLLFPHRSDACLSLSFSLHFCLSFLRSLVVATRLDATCATRERARRAYAARVAVAAARIVSLSASSCVPNDRTIAFSADKFGKSRNGSDGNLFRYKFLDNRN